jgi:two-component system, NtrC family, response regulator HydG
MTEPMANATILIADDEPAVTTPLEAVLSADGYNVVVVSDGEAALARLISDDIALVLTDLKMPGLDGMELLEALRSRELLAECIIITGEASVDTAVEAMRFGAYDYIEKPLTKPKLTRLKALIPKAIEKYETRRKNRELSSRLEGLTSFGELIGQSEPMREVYGLIEAVAPTNASVLVLGESGTGKELVARALHQKSDRAKGPFYALNCAALPKEILENELFGHEKGAFTGSVNEKSGAFENASGGTLFLDELAEMPPDIQVKLLRAIETRSIRRLGGKKEIPVDIRIVAATNKDVQKAIADNELREDLYYRLAVVEFVLPPLRERGTDILILAEAFLQRFSKQNGKRLTGFGDGAREWMAMYPWPGNVRELKNAIERAVILARTTEVSAADLLPRHLRGAAESLGPVTLPVGSSMADARRQMALRTFAQLGGDVAKAAATLGLKESQLREELTAMLVLPDPSGDPPADGGEGSDRGSVRLVRSDEGKTAPGR